MGISEDRIRWNRKYSEPAFEPNWAPDLVLAEKISELPPGRALDLACGIGQNALFLAKRGYEVSAVDLSDVALERLRRAARAEGVLHRIHLQHGDVKTLPLETDAFDVVLVFRFLARQVCPKLYTALKPGGVLLYQTYTTAHRRFHPGFREEFCLKPGELRALFGDLEERFYEEVEDPERRVAYATFLGRRPD